MNRLLLLLLSFYNYESGETGAEREHLRLQDAQTLSQPVLEDQCASILLVCEEGSFQRQYFEHQERLQKPIKQERVRNIARAGEEQI